MPLMTLIQGQLPKCLLFDGEQGHIQGEMYYCIILLGQRISGHELQQ